MTIKYALIVALVLAALACGQEPAASPTQDVRTPTPPPRPTSTTQPGVTPRAASPVNEPGPEPTMSGGPPTIVLEGDWKADKGSIAPGEPVMITLKLKNVSDVPVVFNEFPTTMTLNHMDTRIEESIPIELDSGEGTPTPIGPGEGLSVVAAVSPGVSAGLQSGRYRITGFPFTYTRGRPGWGQASAIMNSEILFVVVPPEGVLDGTVSVGQAREGNHARMTLESIRFTPKQTTISLFAEPLANGSAKPQPTVAGTPTPAIRPGTTPTPTSVFAQSPWDGDLRRLTAFYRLDGGTWCVVLRDHTYRETPDGVRHEWSIDPVSVNANTLEFAIVPRRRPGRDGTFTYPVGDAASSWEWSVPLQGQEQN